MKRCSKEFRKFRRKTPVNSQENTCECRLRPATLLKNRPWHRCFPVNFAKFLRTTFVHNTCERLLLWFISLLHYKICHFVVGPMRGKESCRKAKMKQRGGSVKKWLFRCDWLFEWPFTDFQNCSFAESAWENAWYLLSFKNR